MCAPVQCSLCDCRWAPSLGPVSACELNLKKCDTIFEDYNYLKNYHEKMSPKKNDEYNFFGENRKNLDSEIYNLKNSVDEQYYLMYVYFVIV